MQTENITAAHSFTSAEDWLTYMYGKTQGFITRAAIHKNFRQWHYDQHTLARQRYDGDENVYVSMNSFFKTYRRRECLKKLNALYIDIDCYKEGISKDQALAELRRNHFGKTFPQPTFVIDSGRGLYLIWKIQDDAKALPRWERVMKHLYKHTKGLGADAAAVEPCRILRVPFTVNSASGTPVKILDFYNRTYTLHEIIKEYKITEYKETAKKSTRPAVKRAEDKPAILTGSQRALLQGRINDLYTLYKNRRGPDCRRENALFLMRHWHYRLTGDKEYALQKTLEFNARLDTPHDERYVTSRTASAVKKRGAGYRFSNEKLIEFLHITPEEITNLSHIKRADKSAQKAQKRERNRRNYMDRLAAKGSRTKAEELTIRREALQKMLNEGRSRAEICAALGISESTYKRDKAALAVTELASIAAGTVAAVVETVKKAAKSVMRRTNFQNEAKCGSKTQPLYCEEQRSCSGSARLGGEAVSAEVCDDGRGFWIPPPFERGGRKLC